jgi:hypothetical protein
MQIQAENVLLRMVKWGQPKGPTPKDLHPEDLRPKDLQPKGPTTQRTYDPKDLRS